MASKKTGLNTLCPDRAMRAMHPKRLGLLLRTINLVDPGAIPRDNDETDRAPMTDLERLVRQYIIDPLVAKRAYQYLKEKLIVVAPEPLGSGEDVDSMSIMELLGRGNFSLNSPDSSSEFSSKSSNYPFDNGPITLVPVGSQHAPEQRHDPSDSSAPNLQDQESRNRHPEGNNNQPRDNSAEIVSSGDHEDATGSSLQERTRPVRLRCFHNAIDPCIFRATPDTPQFRSCQGPGWKRWQHVW
jgi:hypothetical protein